MRPRRSRRGTAPPRASRRRGPAQAAAPSSSPDSCPRTGWAAAIARRGARTCGTEARRRRRAAPGAESPPGRCRRRDNRAGRRARDRRASASSARGLRVAPAAALPEQPGWVRPAAAPAWPAAAPSERFSARHYCGHRPSVPRPRFPRRMSRTTRARTARLTLFSYQHLLRSILSNPVAAMDRNDTGGEIKHLYARQAGALEHPGQGRLVGMHADRFGEIAVRRGVAGHLLAQPGQDAERVEIVSALEGLPYLRELEDDEPAARLE